MARVIRALDLREPPPQYELANGRRIQIAYLDAAGWVLLKEWEATPGSGAAARALLHACAPDEDLDRLDSETVEADFSNIIALAKGHAPELLAALKNFVSGAVPEKTTPPTTPLSNPTTTSSTSSGVSPERSARRSRKSTTSGTTPRSQPSTP